MQCAVSKAVARLDRYAERERLRSLWRAAPGVIDTAREEFQKCVLIKEVDVALN